MQTNKKIGNSFLIGLFFRFSSPPLGRILKISEHNAKLVVMPSEFK